VIRRGSAGPPNYPLHPKACARPGADFGRSRPPRVSMGVSWTKAGHLGDKAEGDRPYSILQLHNAFVNAIIPAVT
jgi:hypothetical protein